MRDSSPRTRWNVSDIGAGKGGGVGGTIASHGAEMSKALETKLQVSPSLTLTAYSCLPFDDLVLVLREDTNEAIGIHNYLAECSMLSTGAGPSLRTLAGYTCSPSLRLRPASLAIASWSPAILTVIPRARASLMVCLVSSREGLKMTRSPMSSKPFASSS